MFFSFFLLGWLGSSAQAATGVDCLKGPQLLAEVDSLVLSGEQVVCTDSVVRGGKVQASFVIEEESGQPTGLIYFEGHKNGSKMDIVFMRRYIQQGLFPLGCGKNIRSVRIMPRRRKILLLYRDPRLAYVQFFDRRPELYEWLNLTDSSFSRSCEIEPIHWRDLDRDRVDFKIGRKRVDIILPDESHRQLGCDVRKLSPTEQKKMCDDLQLNRSVFTPDTRNMYEHACDQGELKKCSFRSKETKYKLHY